MIYLLFLLNFFLIPVNTETNDVDLIKETLNNYIFGRNEGDTARLKKAFHPTAALKFVDYETGKLREISSSDYVARQTPGKRQNCTAAITNIHLFGNAAQATVVLTYPNFTFHDYMSLLKIEGEWLIVDKIFSREPNEK